MLRFGVVGGIGTVFDLGGAALLHGMYGFGALEAKGVSVFVAGVITYLLSRYWTFRGRDSQELKRQAFYFVVINVIGLLMAEAIVGLITDLAGFHGQVAFNLASFFGTGVGTIFRYVTYRKWVFIADDTDFGTDAPAVGSVPSPGAFGGAAPAGPAPGAFGGAGAFGAPDLPQRVPDYAPWELDPSFLNPAPKKVPEPVGAPVRSYAATREEHRPLMENREVLPPWEPALAPAPSDSGRAPQVPSWDQFAAASRPGSGQRPEPGPGRRSPGRHRKH
jgi:putative flippase GtrA